MKSFTTVSILAMAAAVYAQNNTAPGVSPNLASCRSKYTQCTSGSSATCDADLQTCQAACDQKFNDCSVAPNANHATCVAAFDTCLGEDFRNLPKYADNYVTVTEVVPSYTTYCPGATTLFNNGQSYVATGPTVLTITNCPCTVVRTVSAVPTGNQGYSNTSVPYTPETYKGTAGKAIGISLSVLAGVSGVLAFML